jgi:hypothetical protein
VLALTSDMRQMRTFIPRAALHRNTKVGLIATGCNRAASDAKPAG